MRACLLIPVLEHGAEVRRVLASLAGCGLPCLIVDDGSSAPTRAALERIASEFPFASVHLRARRGGKGAALRDGYAIAARLGFSHVVQLDADGQHEPGDVPRFLEAMRKEPRALVLGEPIFDAGVPRVWLWVRQLSRVSVWIGTLSLEIRDPLCGMRGVPLGPVLRVLLRHRLGNHGEFEPELAARCLWEGVPIRNLPTRVTYRPGERSPFQSSLPIVRDFARLGAAYARLWLGMLRRAPLLLARHAP